MNTTIEFRTDEAGNCAIQVFCQGMYLFYAPNMRTALSRLGDYEADIAAINIRTLQAERENLDWLTREDG